MNPTHSLNPDEPPKPSPSLRARSAASCLRACPNYAALVWWLDGDRQCWRDSAGQWFYYGNPMKGDVAIDMENVWADAVRIDALFPTEDQQEIGPCP